MPPDTAFPNTLGKSEKGSTFRDASWTTLMSDVLMGTPIFKNENGSDKGLDPKVVMDMRHKMVKQYSKMYPTPQEQINTNALELLRTENHNRMRRQRDDKLIEIEIARLKQILENRRLLTKKALDEIPKRTNPSFNKTVFPKQFTKLYKKIELSNGTCEVDTWTNNSVEMAMETKISPQGIPLDVKISLKRQAEEEFSDHLSTRKGSVIDEEFECENQCFEESNGKTEIIKRFFKEEDELEVKPEVKVDVKKEIKVREISEIVSKMNRRRVEHAWVTWRAFIEQLKNRKKEKTIYKRKIEAFLSNLQQREREMAEVKKQMFKKVTNRKEVRKTVFTKTEIGNKQLENEKNEKLEKLKQEIKVSQTEAANILREIKKNQLETQKKYVNIKFLQRMEERNAERKKRRREIQEKRQILEEERENARKQKEIEQKQKKMEELKEMRRLEKEKREEQKREKEKLKLNMNLAETHYRNYLLRSCGLRPWKIFMKMRDVQQQLAVDFFERKLTHKLFLLWATNVREEMGFRRRRADEFYEWTLKKNCLRIWMELHREKKEQNQVAVDWNELKITERAFTKWLRFTLDERLQNINRNSIAVLKYEQRLKMKYLKKLRDYPELKKLEQAKENRKRKWRQKVKEILPDFQPIEIS